MQPSPNVPKTTVSAAHYEGATKVRFFVVLLLFIGVAINYLDRTNLAVAAPVIQHDLHISAATLGFIFSAFGWLYMLMQLPAGIVLDRFGTRRTFGWSLTLWSSCTVLFGFAGSALHLVVLRAALGITEAPCFPAGQKAVTAWFPKQERGMAVGLYISGEFLGLALLTPVLAWIVARHGTAGTRYSLLAGHLAYFLRYFGSSCTANPAKTNGSTRRSLLTCATVAR